MTKTKFIHRVGKSHGWNQIVISGYKFECLGFDFVAHRYTDHNGNQSSSWMVSELSTGLPIGVIENTRKAAIEDAKKSLGKRGKDLIARSIDAQLKEIGIRSHSEQDISFMLNKQRLDRMHREHDESIDYMLASMAGYTD